MSRVTLYTKPGCHLCDDARAVVVAVCAETGADWSEVDITQDGELYAEYGEQIPVTFVDGKQHDFWRVDAERLRKALGTAPKPGLLDRLRRRGG
ncbi:glutaredoxin family protein [Kribbella sandramycini]|uniref:Glutaredoxin n=1 Tax=Kribbella sandramycini TaxID=60450 RepID=A0A7Y4P1Y8_9ACTN|nr:glutaredoxin family protein [Kribbella sandramycini]MBB6564877.1 glutaredoxin [Kribbella sandramycini]NOL42574.1 glutaredoxin family protein [Kribbella sandramycini]